MTTPSKARRYTPLKSILTPGKQHTVLCPETPHHKGVRRKSDGITSIAETPDKGDGFKTVASPRRQETSLAVRRKASFYSGGWSRNVKRYEDSFNASLLAGNLSSLNLNSSSMDAISVRKDSVASTGQGYNRSFILFPHLVNKKRKREDSLGGEDLLNSSLAEFQLRTKMPRIDSKSSVKKVRRRLDSFSDSPDPAAFCRLSKESFSKSSVKSLESTCLSGRAHLLHLHPGQELDLSSIPVGIKTPKKSQDQNVEGFSSSWKKVTFNTTPQPPTPKLGLSAKPILKTPSKVRMKLSLTPEEDFESRDENDNVISDTVEGETVELDQERPRQLAMLLSSPSGSQPPSAGPSSNYGSTGPGSQGAVAPPPVFTKPASNKTNQLARTFRSGPKSFDTSLTRQINIGAGRRERKNLKVVTTGRMITKSKDNSLKECYVKIEKCPSPDQSFRMNKRKKEKETTENKCNVCHYTAMYVSTLKIHMRSHTGETPFKCSICNSSFSKACSLKTHTRTHTGAKPYKCNTCSYSCSTSSYLKNHIRTHTGERPHKCTICNFCSISASDLRRHNRTHTGEKPYICKMCKNSFTLSSHLRRHEKKKHGVQCF